MGIMSLDETIKYAKEHEYAPYQKVSDEQISRDAVIDLIFNNEKDMSEEVFNALTNGIYNLPSVTQKSGKWIPVSERLPEAEYGESNSVLVCFENQTQGVLYFDGSNWRYPTGEIYISVNHKNGWHNKVVAWMPLPKPFEPQESEEE